MEAEQAFELLKTLLCVHLLIFSLWRKNRIPSSHYEWNSSKPVNYIQYAPFRAPQAVTKNGS